MITCVISEKPCGACDIACTVGANRREDGSLEGTGYLVTWALVTSSPCQCPNNMAMALTKPRNYPSFHSLPSSWCAQSAKAKTLKTIQPLSSNSKSSVPVLKKRPNHRSHRCRTRKRTHLPLYLWLPRLPKALLAILDFAPHQ